MIVANIAFISSIQVWNGALCANLIPRSRLKNASQPQKTKNWEDFPVKRRQEYSNLCPSPERWKDMAFRAISWSKAVIHNLKEVSNISRRWDSLSIQGRHLRIYLWECCWKGGKKRRKVHKNCIWQWNTNLYYLRSLCRKWKRKNRRKLRKRKM